MVGVHEEEEEAGGEVVRVVVEAAVAEVALTNRKKGVTMEVTVKTKVTYNVTIVKSSGTMQLSARTREKREITKTI